MTETSPDLKVDASGKFCPVPILEIARAVKSVGAGQLVELIATDPGVQSDLPAWCKATRNQLVLLEQQGSVWRALVRRT